MRFSNITKTISVHSFIYAVIAHEHIKNFMYPSLPLFIQFYLFQFLKRSNILKIKWTSHNIWQQCQHYPFRVLFYPAVPIWTFLIFYFREDIPEEDQIWASRWRRKWQPTPVFLPGESQGRGSLVGCRLWGRTESDTTEAT